jgi:site-specific DNA recombinase
MGTPIRACAYFRASTDKQEESIPQQRDWAERTCKREGVAIAASFEDPGIAGDEIKLRPGLQALLDYCERAHKEGRPVDCVVTWNADRFSRADSIRTAAILCRLLDAGVTRMLTSEGWIDFEDDTDRMLHTIKQDASRAAYSKTLSANVSRAAVKRAREGKYNGGRISYGYILGPDGRLTPDERLKVEGAVTVFTLAAAGLSSQRIAREMDRRGYPPPLFSKGKWSKRSILDMLKNRVYLGEKHWGKNHAGKYSECTADGVKKRRNPPRTASGRLRQVRKPETAIVTPQAHPPLISQELWDAARRAIEAQCDLPRGTRRRSHKWPLSGLAFCAHCGGRMCGIVLKAGKKQGNVELRHYVCGNYIAGGRQSCAYRHIGEDMLSGAAFEAVRLALSDADGMRRVRAAVEKEASAERGCLAGRAESLRKRAAELEAKARQGAERLAILPPDLVDDVAAVVRRWREERDQLLVEAGQVEEAMARADDGRRRVEEAMQAFERLGEWMSEPSRVSPDLQAQALSALIDRLECRFAEHALGPKRTQCRPIEVKVHFRDLAGILKAVNVPISGLFQGRDASAHHNTHRRSFRPGGSSRCRTSNRPRAARP